MGETAIELLFKSKYLQSANGETWTDRQKARARLFFKMFQPYTLISSLRNVFSNKPVDWDTKAKLHEPKSVIRKFRFHFVLK